MINSESSDLKPIVRGNKMHIFSEEEHVQIFSEVSALAI